MLEGVGELWEEARLVEEFGGLEVEIAGVRPFDTETESTQARG